ncbi:MAG: hypothetical protein ACRCWG_05070 [Sarcina sp.]
MNLIKFEVKKLFTIKTVGLAGVVALLLYSLTINHNIEFFASGDYKKIDYALANEMLDDYGSYMDKSEFEDFKKNINVYEEKAENVIKNNGELKKYGVTNLEEFQVFMEESDFSNEKIRDLIREIESNEDILAYESRNLLIENYNKRVEIDEIQNYYTNSTIKDIERIKEVRLREDTKTPIPYFFLRNTESLGIGLFGIVALTIFLIIAPIFISDKNNKVNYLQHGSKIGRKIFKSKLIAEFVAATIITTVEILIIGALYSTTGAFRFWNCSINSELMGGFIRAVDLTVGQHIILIGFFGYIVAFAVAGISMFISIKANTYIAVLGFNIIAVGSIFMMAFFSLDLFAGTMQARNLQIGGWLVIALIGIVSSIYILKNQRRLDTVE